MLRLHQSPTSPFVRMVRVLLHEADLADRVELVPVSGSPLEPGSMPVGQNPLGKIPTLERADGAALHDSRVISRYLDDLAEGRFYPPKPRLWETLTLEAIGHGMAEAAVLMTYEVRLRPADRRSAEWVEAQWSKVGRSLDVIEARWMSHLAGPVDCAQIACASTLSYIDLRHGDRNWRTGRPALTAWEARFSERPSMKATLAA